MNLRQLREIYHRVKSAAPSDREAALAEACAGDESLRTEVQALLDADARAGAFLADPTMNLHADDGQLAVREALPFPSLGAYQLVEKIGEGGYGEVFLAEQSEPVRRRVALKMLKAGLDTRQVLARFEAERQTLAMMDHPGIARIFDAGTTAQGRPYFVMELVDGVPVTEFCMLRKLSPKERLDLFCDVCRAVQHAHAKGVIHRDLKPSNILVSEVDGRPRPVVIDFGIAKAMRGLDAGATLHTGLRQLMGTPAYMSPEQAGLEGPDVDTRSDIYSLGVLLYELLTGVTPFDASQLRAAALAEIQRRLSEEVPAKPSTRVAGLTAAATGSGLRADFAAPVRLLKGDLDWIVMKALEKEPGRRYASAAAFAEDIVRHIGNEPVSAGPPSFSYRFRKWVRRNRAAAAAAAILTIAAGVGISGLGYGYVISRREIKARTAEATARRIQAERAESLLRLQSEIFASANPETAKGSEYTVRRLLDDFSVNFGSSLQVEPDVEIALRHTVGRAYQALADFDRAGAHFRTALDLSIRTHGARARETGECHYALGHLLRDHGHYQDARTELEAAAGMLPPGSTAWRAARAVLAGTLKALNEPERAAEIARTVMPWPEDSTAGIRPLQLTADILAEQDDFPAADAAASRALDLAMRADGGPGGARSIGPLHTMAGLRLRQKRPTEAEAFARQALEIATTRLGEEHPVTQMARGRLADIHRETAGAAKAVEERTGVLASLLKSLGDEHPDTFDNFLGLLGAVIQSNPDAARDLVFNAMGASREARDAGEPVGTDTMNPFARKILAGGRIGDYEAIAVKGLEIVRRAFGEDHRNTIDVERALAFVLRQQDRDAEAEKIYRDSIAKCTRAFGADHPMTIEGRLLLAELQQKMKRRNELDRTLAGLHPLIDTRPRDGVTGHHYSWLAGILEGENRDAEALAAADAALPLLSAARPQSLASLHLMRARLMRSLGLIAPCVEAYQSALTIAREAWGANSMNDLSIRLQLMGMLENTSGWRSGLKMAEEALEDLRRAFPDNTRMISTFTAKLQSFRNLAADRTAKVVKQKEVYQQFTAQHGPEAPESLEALRLLSSYQASAGDIPAADKLAAEYESLMKQQHAGDTAVLAEVSAFRAWMRFLYFPDPDRPAALEQVRAALREGEPDSDPAKSVRNLRLLSNSAVVLRQSGFGEEFLALMDTLEDRRLDARWPDESRISLIPRNAVWQHSRPLADPGDAWRSDPAFDDSSWPRGPAPVGFGNALVFRSTVDVDKSEPAGRPVLFRHVFDCPDPAAFDALKIRLRAVDGALVLLNGQEILRRAVAPAAAWPAPADKSLEVTAAPIPKAELLPDALKFLRPGRNLLAVQLHLGAERAKLFRACLDLSLEVRKKAP